MAVLDYIQSQLKIKFLVVPVVNGFSWADNVYEIVSIKEPATVLDCFVNCYYININECQFFAFENGNCFLGSFSVKGGGLSGNPPVDATVYVNTSKVLSFVLDSLRQRSNFEALKPQSNFCQNIKNIILLKAHFSIKLNNFMF